MLTLSRREGESIYLYVDGMQPIQIVMSGLKNGHARVSISAPEDVHVLREELLDSDEMKNAS